MTTSAQTAEIKLREGDPAASVRALQDEVRKNPVNADLRVFLFQLLAVTGQWERALTQLNVAADLDAKTLAMAQTYREAIRCEVLRAKVFEGKSAPMVLGQPEQWLALLIESLLRSGQGSATQADELRTRAFDEAPGSTGTIDGKPFEWIADADMRLGPVLEAIINGAYYWVPFSRMTRISIEAPADLRDKVWMPAHLSFDNGGESVALIPTRYPGSETSDDNAILLARKTLWEEPAPEVFFGLGQRVIATDHGDIPLMDIREITISESGSAREEDHA